LINQFKGIKIYFS